MEQQPKEEKGSRVNISDLNYNEKDVVEFIASLSEVDKDKATKARFQILLRAASQPRHVSGNACIKLCYFVELCRSCDSKSVQDFAFSHSTFLNLFSFYVEWNEKNQHRSMRQIIELIAKLLSVNPDKDSARLLRVEILRRLLSIISHQSAQPLVKPAFKAMECLMSKGALPVREIFETYHEVAIARKNGKVPVPYQSEIIVSPRDSFISDVFEWMSFPDTAPSAGKMLVTIFQLSKLPCTTQMESPEIHTLWQRWIRRGLARYPQSLENVKNYLLPPLFKLDKPGSLAFLRDLSQGNIFDNFGGERVDGQELLLLSAMEVGKKVGLVDDPNPMNPPKGSGGPNDFVVLPEDMIGSLLNHSSSAVRSTALSVLISSLSSIRPFPPSTLIVLQNNLAVLHADTDARIRNEVLSNSKLMVGRLRGAIAYLTRENDIPVRNETLDDLLCCHTAFLQWYLQFLSAELVPTASYQRHITALKAIKQLAKSGILSAEDVNGQAASISQPIWPFSVNLFMPSMLDLLLDLMVNPFEDVRMSACSILQLAPLKSFYNDKIQGVRVNPSKLSSDGNRDLVNFNLKEFFRIQTAVREDSGDLGMLYRFIKVAEDASDRSGRADLADGVARSYGLLSSLLPSDHSRYRLLEALLRGLDHKVTIAEISLPRAVQFAPVHGQFASLRMVWDTVLKSPDRNNTSEQYLARFETKSIDLDWNNLQRKIIVLCDRVWDCVEKVLCNDSPEGHLLDDLEDVESIETKDVLSYSFRAIHESSNLLQVIVNKIKPSGCGGGHLLPFDLFQQVGNLTFTQLSDLRHRGAFSTVSLTFARCCQLTQDYISTEKDNFLIQKWYQVICYDLWEQYLIDNLRKASLSCIREHVSTTRRSAGIPALITGILSANSRFSAFDDVLRELKILARKPAKLLDKDETALPQVHAMNCLKEIFKSSILGKRCENHITDCLAIAADSLNSERWAIRNCGLLLLRSLTDCLFGTSESKAIMVAGWDGRSIKLSYERYPALPELLVKLLSVDPDANLTSDPAASSVVESVFPALDIIRRAGPPPNHREKIFPIISRYLGSKVWHLRDIVARTVCTLLLHDDWLQEVASLLESCHGSANRLHGVLLSIRYLLERRFELDPVTASDGLADLAIKIYACQNSHHWVNGCAIIDAAYADMTTVHLKIISQNDIINMSTMQNLLQSNYTVEPSPPKVEFWEWTAESPLLRKATALRVLVNATCSSQTGQVYKNLVLAAENDVDTTLAVLEAVSLQWKTHEFSSEELINLRAMYIDVLTATKSSEVRGAVLRALAAVLERLSILFTTSAASPNHLHAPCLSNIMNGGPGLSNAEIRITGSLLLHESLSMSQKESVATLSRRIEAWGKMLSGMLKDENDFDTRYAAVMSLGAFYRVVDAKVSEHLVNSCFVPSILTLYDSLNDDDDEIRDLGAGIVSHIMKVSQVPMAAGRGLLPWCLKNFGGTEPFRFAILYRLTGNKDLTKNLIPAAEHLRQALKVNDSLFAEEEQNLYIDEVREILLWNSLITSVEDPSWDPMFDRLYTWIVEGLVELEDITKLQIYGWTSKPKVFAEFMRIIVAAKTVLSRLERNNLVHRGRAQILGNQMENLFAIGTQFHVHLLLLEELGSIIAQSASTHP